MHVALLSSLFDFCNVGNDDVVAVVVVVVVVAVVAVVAILFSL